MEQDFNFQGNTYFCPTTYAQKLGVHRHTLVKLMRAGLIVADCQLANGNPLFSGRDYIEHRKIANYVHRQR